MKFPLTFSVENDDIVVTSAHFPELLTFGGTKQEAIANAEDALSVVLLTYIEKGLPIPDLNSHERGPNELEVFVPAQVTAKIAVIQAFNEAGISKSELARRMGVAENEARRILDPDFGTKLDKLDDAMRAMGEHLEVRRVA